jgi:cytochrome c-type biogenesis protein CcmH
MMLPFVLAALAFLTLLAVVSPLLRGSRGLLPRAQYDQAVYRDQLHELDRDIARGLLTDTEAQSARLEIQRRLLAAEAAPARETRLSRSPALAAAVGLLVAGGSVGLYLWIGAPGIPDMPFASRNLGSGDMQDADGAPGHVDLQQAAAKLAAKLRANPADQDGWLLYGRTEAMLSQWNQAADAYHHAIDLGAKGADVFSGYGEMLVMQGQGIVTPAAHDAFLTALKDDPKNDVSRYYLALAAGQAGDAQKAIDMLQGLLADIPDDSPMRAEIGKRIAEAAKSAGLPMPELAKGTPPESPPGSPAESPAAAPSGAPGPDEAAMAAAAGMSEADRKTMISGMVAKLAAELQAKPDNLDGWMRLGRAYAVLGERDKASDAYEHAVSLRPSDVGIRLQAVQSLLLGLKPNDPLPPGAVTLLRQVQMVAPDQPEVLWYLGVVAARDAHPDEARRYWSRLLAKLPANGEDAKLVQTALDALKGG